MVHVCGVARRRENGWSVAIAGARGVGGLSVTVAKWLVVFVFLAIASFVP